MLLHIKRIKESEEGTLGKFELLNDEKEVLLKGSTIEREGPDTTERGLNKRIPIGLYNTIMHDSNRAKMIVPLLYNDEVPKDRYILIHPGNSIKDLEGCIALGSSDNGENFIYKSRKTIESFLSLIEGEDLKVEIEEDYNNA